MDVDGDGSLEGRRQGDVRVERQIVMEGGENRGYMLNIADGNYVALQLGETGIVNHASPPLARAPENDARSHNNVNLTMRLQRVSSLSFKSDNQSDK